MRKLDIPFARAAIERDSPRRSLPPAPSQCSSLPHPASCWLDPTMLNPSVFIGFRTFYIVTGGTPVHSPAALRPPMNCPYLPHFIYLHTLCFTMGEYLFPDLIQNACTEFSSTPPSGSPSRPCAAWYGPFAVASISSGLIARVRESRYPVLCSEGGIRSGTCAAAVPGGGPEQISFHLTTGRQPTCGGKRPAYPRKTTSKPFGKCSKTSRHPSALGSPRSST